MCWSDPSPRPCGTRRSPKCTCLMHPHLGFGIATAIRWLSSPVGGFPWSPSVFRFRLPCHAPAVSAQASRQPVVIHLLCSACPARWAAARFGAFLLSQQSVSSKKILDQGLRQSAHRILLNPGHVLSGDQRVADRFLSSVPGSREESVHAVIWKLLDRGGLLAAKGSWVSRGEGEEDIARPIAAFTPHP